jgi:RND family efflux transporter MFP subunit
LKNWVNNTSGIVRFVIVFVLIVFYSSNTAIAQTKRVPELSSRAKTLDTNSNGVIDRNEARGPDQENFDIIDLDKNGKLDGNELVKYFQGGGKSNVKELTPLSESLNKQNRPLSPIAKNLDSNNNGFLERDEARGPGKENFDAIDLDKNAKLDGNELFKFFQGGKSSKKSVSGGGRPANVAVDLVISEPLSQTVPVLGRIISDQYGPISARVRGPVNKILVDVGDRVERGTIIALLDLERLSLTRDRFTALVNQQSAKLTSVRADMEKRSLILKRLEAIRKSVAFSQARYEDAIQEVNKQRGKVAETVAQLTQAKIQLKQANIDLQYGKIRAPYPGVVSSKHTEVGAYLNIGSTVVRLINDTDIMIDSDVPGSLLEGLQIGASIRLLLDDKTEHNAIVLSVVPNENPRTRTRQVRFKPHFNVPRRSLAINQSVTLYIPIGLPSAVITVSKDAILQHRGENTVFVERNGSGIPQKVQLGVSVGSRFVVKSGLKPGDVVVVRGNENLRPGQRLKVSSGTKTSNKYGPGKVK